ncbi:MAG: branched-chain amino acid transaminase [Acidobacteriota bacterium]|nr:branched-chain amino acid transaminase [Acidobacteriota bacterium]MDH3522357.1 branched-chain amino acid transaminase [Acidobacteriota bacterium]
MTDLKTPYVWLDGRLIPTEEATVHLLTHTLHYGLGVFEGTRAYEQVDGGSAIFRLEDHLWRLGKSANAVKLKIPFDKDALRQASLDIMAANGLPTCYLRHIVWIGAGVMGLHPKDNPIRCAILTWPWGAYLGKEGIEKGVRCKVSSYMRPFPNSTMTKAKVIGNYVNSILAKREATAMGYDEAIMLDTNGYLAECSGENIFVVRGNTVKTPALTSVLEGITRESVMQIARDLGYDVQQTIMTRDEMYFADEVFMTGTAAEVTPVREVDDRPVGDGVAGPVTKQIQSTFFQAIRGELPEYRSWLTPVPVEAAVNVS